MLSILTDIHLEDAKIIEQRRDDYLHTLSVPMDGMWEGAIIGQAAFWDIRRQGQLAGYFCIGADSTLLRVHLLEDYQVQAQEIFRWVLTTHGIQTAIVSTSEPLYFALCIDLQQSLTLHDYLFRDHKRLEPPASPIESSFRQAGMPELRTLMDFYRANIDDPSQGLEAFLRERLLREELFVMSDQQTLVAAGECIPSQRQKPYTDLGMVVAQAYRGQGLGSAMLRQLKQRCYAANWKPICSCAADNIASKKAIEKAGFLSEQRIVKVTFPNFDKR